MAKKTIIYFGHGITGYSGIQKIMRSPLRDNLSIQAVVVSDTDKQKADLVANIAKEYELPVIVEAANSPQLGSALNHLHPDLGVIMHFDQKIPDAVVKSCIHGIWNVHPSEL